jgi:arginine-tRNA-protein transferase
MRYKSQYSPSDIVCPETYEWVPVERCLPLLDRSKYSRLSPEDVVSSQEIDLDEVGVLFQRQAMQVIF